MHCFLTFRHMLGALPMSDVAGQPVPDWKLVFPSCAESDVASRPMPTASDVEVELPGLWRTPVPYNQSHPMRCAIVDGKRVP